MNKKMLSVLLALVLLVSLSLVTAVPAAAAGGDYTDAITKTADRLVALQGTDGGWDWIVTDLTAHSGTIPSEANLFGVTALGLIDAYELTEDMAYKTAAQLTADHLKTLSRAIDPNVRFQTFDYRFLVEFSALSEDPSYAAHALSEWNWVKANVASFYADGNQETIYTYWVDHAGPGFAAWQAADCGLAALDMGDTSYASNMAAVLAGHLPDIASDDIYRFIGLGHALEFLNAVDPVLYSDAIASLTDALIAIQNEDGSWGTGENSEGYTQDVAYAIMGLAAVGRLDATVAAAKGADWLITEQDYGTIVGGWNTSTDAKEYSESDSEALQALATAGIDSDGDGFSDAEEYFVGTDPNDPEDYPGAPVVAGDIVTLPTSGSGGAAIPGVASVDATAGDVAGATVTLAEYSAAPESESVFGAVGSYIDVHCDTPENLTSVTVTIKYDPGIEGDAELALRMSYWNSDVGDWRQCSDQGVNIVSNYIWATITALTTPDLDYLSGGPFGGGPMSVELDSEWYSTGDTVAVTIEDADQSGLIAASAWSDTVGEFLPLICALIETDIGIFEGSFDLVGTPPGAGELLVNDGDLITVSYLEVGYTATVDDTVPVITIVSPLASANITENKPLIQADYADIGGSGTDNATTVMTLDGDAVIATATESQVTYTPSANLAEGSHTVTVDIDDLAGNAATQASWSFTVDTIAPAITLQVATPSVILPNTETPVVFTATVTDEASGVATVTIDLTNVGGGAAVAMLDADADGIYTASENITESTEANHPLTVTAIDGTGNSDTADIILGVFLDIIDPDISGPAITYPFVGVDSAQPGDDVTISVTVTDAGGMGTVTADCTVFEATPVDLTQGVGDAWSVTAAIDGAAGWGDYTITITATDAKGNVVTDESLTLAVRTGATGTTIVLVEGWNLISLPLIPDDSNITVVVSVDTLLSGNVSSVGIVRGYDLAIGEFPAYIPGIGGDLTTMEDGLGYWVFMVEADTLTITGSQWPAPPEVPPTYDVVVGWNLIGFKSMSADIDTNYLANIADTYPVLWSYDAVAGAYENVTEVEGGMVVGHGFWIWINEPGTIVPPQ